MNRRMFIASMIGGLVSAVTGKPILEACVQAKVKPEEIEKLKPQLRYIRIADIKPGLTARLPLSEAHPHVLLLTESIKEMGMVNPITVTTSLMLIDGTYRVMAAKAAGLETCPAYVLDLTEAEVLEYQILSNSPRRI